MVPVLISFDDISLYSMKKGELFIEKCYFLFKLKIDNLEV